MLVSDFWDSPPPHTHTHTLISCEKAVLGSIVIQVGNLMSEEKERGKREKEREIETDRQTDRQTETETNRGKQTDS